MSPSLTCCFGRAVAQRLGSGVLPITPALYPGQRGRGHVAAGARVIAAARGEHKLALAQQLGADVVIDYSTPDWADRLRQQVAGVVAVVFDGVGGQIGRAAFEVTTHGG
mgnify:CR=1 FL=1